MRTKSIQASVRVRCQIELPCHVWCVADLQLIVIRHEYLSLRRNWTYILILLEALLSVEWIYYRIMIYFEEVGEKRTCLHTICLEYFWQ